MPYGTPTSNENRGQYTGSAEVTPDGVNFSEVTFTFALNWMPISNDGDLDDIFESLITHIAEHPMVFSVQANKIWENVQVVTPVED